MSSRRGALALSFSAVPKRASARAITKASSSAERPSPSRPQPKCFSRAADISGPPVRLSAPGRLPHSVHLDAAGDVEGDPGDVVGLAEVDDRLPDVGRRLLAPKRGIAAHKLVEGLLGRDAE